MNTRRWIFQGLSLALLLPGLFSFSFLAFSKRSCNLCQFQRLQSASTEVTQELVMNEEEPTLDILSGIGELADKFDVFLIDMWGVMHDGVTPYEGVLDAVKQLKKANKEMIVLSNSSKRKSNSEKSLRRLGFDPNDFAQIITSGEVSYHLLLGNGPDESPLAPLPWSSLEISGDTTASRVAFCLGSGEGDKEYVESCGWKLGAVQDADVVVARGTFSICDGQTTVHKNVDGEEIYEKGLQEALVAAAKRKLPMIVANPDKIRPDADRSPMPGMIGDAYEKLVGAEDLIKRIGKPFPDVYDIALRGRDRSRVCMIGDALETDVTGGSAVDVATVWVINDGVHGAEVARAGNGSLEAGCSSILASFNDQSDTYARGRKLRPTFVVPHFRW